MFTTINHKLLAVLLAGSFIILCGTAACAVDNSNSQNTSPTHPIPGLYSLEAENGRLLGNAQTYADSEAAGGLTVSVAAQEDGIDFAGVLGANQIEIRYASSGYGQLSLYINGEHKSDVPFPATGGRSGYFSLKTVVIDVPDGAGLTLQYDKDDTSVNIDYIRFVNINNSFVEAESAAMLGSALAYNDAAASKGKAIELNKLDDGVRFFSVTGGNMLQIRYAAGQDREVSLYVNKVHVKDIRLPGAGAPGRVYKTVAQSVDIPAGATVELRLNKGDSAASIDYLQVSTTQAGRTITSLSGIWECEEATYPDKDSIPSKWDHQIQVPGLADMASPALGNYDYLFYRQTFAIGEDVPSTVKLRINQASWGKKVWVNGSLVGEHQPNFTPGYFDIKPYVKGHGEINTVVIRVGKIDTQPPGWNTGTDYEKRQYIPGIYDEISVITSGAHQVLHVQTAPDLDNGKVRVVAQVRNNSNQSAQVPVRLEVREALSGKLVGTQKTTLNLAGATEGTVDEFVNMQNLHVWTPENPFLYTLSVKTDDDSFDTKFGMRTFAFDPVAKKPMLNGKIYMLRGTNFTFYRFNEDSERGSLLWNKEWARQVIKAHKALNMNSARYCIGFPPEIWYEVADEEGFLIQDEYPIWRKDQVLANNATAQTITSEVTDWIYTRNNHPSVIIWDIANETTNVLTDLIIYGVRGIDIQKRVWDNAWRPAVSPTDTLEQHEYFNRPGNAIWTTTKLGALTLSDQYAPPQNPVVVNEYGWIWLTRGGNPTSLSQEMYKVNVTGGTIEQRRAYHDLQLAQETEWFRANRYAAVMQFCGLGYSRLNGHTSDNWLPGITHPVFRESFQKQMQGAMAPVGVMIGYWDAQDETGSTRNIPVYVMNDQNQPWSGEVTLKILQDATVLSSITLPFHDVATGYRASRDFTVTIPHVPGSYQMIAEYQVGGTAVQSIRKFQAVSASMLSQIKGDTYLKPAKASSSLLNRKVSYSAANVTDGDLGTRWVSASSDPQWIYIDLGETKNITEVELHWEAAYGTSYELQVSDDANNWTTIYSQNRGTGGKEVIRDLSGTGRYIRLYGKTRTNPKWGYSLWEFIVRS